jgi:hypothetical protein
MKISKEKRSFIVGKFKKIKLVHSANIYLNNNEFVTFVDKKKGEYDFCKKDWGYYVSPSINFRLKKFKYKVGLFVNEQKRKYIFAVKVFNIKKLKKYQKEHKIKLIQWL